MKCARCEIAEEMLAMLREIADTLPDLDWSGSGCCPFCEMKTPQGPCEFAALIIRAGIAISEKP